MGDGGDGRGRARVLDNLQVIVGAGKVPPRRAWFLVGGPLGGFLRTILPGSLWAFTLSGTKVGALRRKDKPLAAIWDDASRSCSWRWILALDQQSGAANRQQMLAASPMEVEVLRTVGNSVSKRELGMMHVPWRCLDSICHSVASANQEAIWTMYTGKGSCGESFASQRSYSIKAFPVRDPPPADDTPFQPLNPAGRGLVGKYIFFKWPRDDWCLGQWSEWNSNPSEKIWGKIINFKVQYFDENIVNNL